MVDPGDPRRDRGHARGAGHRHRKPPGGAGQFPRGAFEIERRTGRWWTLGGLALGSVEIVLGAIVLVAGSGNLRLVTVAIAAWGLIGGMLLLLEGFKIRRSLRAL